MALTDKQFRSLKKSLLSQNNELRAVPQPAKIFEMPTIQENGVVHLGHGLGYSSRPQNFGDGKTPIFSSYRAVGGTGEEPW